MVSRELKFEDKKIVLEKLSECYLKSLRRIEIYEYQGIKEESTQYHADLIMIEMIEIMLNACSENTQIIIKNEYLNHKRHEWYLDYYSRSNYYRLKKQAISEFIDCLNI